MYPPSLTDPIKKELANQGFVSLTESQEVEDLVSNSKGTLLLLVNSVCGCAAGSARPALYAAIQHSSQTPSTIATVFAGVDQAATQKAREYMKPYPPSSPSVALFKDGELIHVVERQQIESNTAQALAEHFLAVFEEYC